MWWLSRHSSAQVRLCATLRTVASTSAATPGYLGKGAADIVGQLAAGDALVVLGDATLADNLIWWRIRFAPGNGNSVEGWVAEATASGVQILGE